MSQLRNYSPDQFERAVPLCYYCAKPGLTNSKHGPVICNKAECPALQPNAARVRENEVMELATSVAIKDLEKHQFIGPGFTTIPYTETRSTRCWFCFWPDAREVFGSEDRAWCGSCPAQTLLFDQAARVRVRSNYLFNTYKDDARSSFVAPCPGCLKPKSGLDLLRNTAHGTILCSSCEDYGPQEP